MATWFQSQIEERERGNRERLADAFQVLSDAVTGRDTVLDREHRRQANLAIAQVLAFFGLRPRQAPRAAGGIRSLMDYHTRPLGVMYRQVRLDAGWTRDAIGPMLGFLEDDTPVALLPGRSGYRFEDPASGETVRVGSRGARAVRPEAYCFYRPLPDRELSVRDLVAFLAGSVGRSDWLKLLVAVVCATLVGLLVPTLTRMAFGPIVDAGDAWVLAPLFALFAGVTVSKALLEAIRGLVVSGIGTRLNVTLASALAMRLLSLPARFFRGFRSGELELRLEAVNDATMSVAETAIGVVMNAVFSLVYLVMIFSLASSLTLPAFLVTLGTVLVALFTGVVQVGVTRRRLALDAELNGWQYELLRGMRKIKLAGAEDRGFGIWARSYARTARILYNGPLVQRLAGAASLAVSLAGTIAFYVVALGAHVPVDDFVAFTAAFGLLAGACSELASTATDLGSVLPRLEMLEPFLAARPETGEHRPVISRVRGHVAFENVTFSYGPGRPEIVKDLSLTVPEGQYLAIVGESGCGKSTLLRLLLGFEQPERGAVYIDRRDIASVDASSLRRSVGAVLQGERLMKGDLFSNIAASDPWLSEEEVWEAAELADIASDIRALPLGLQTPVGEEGGFSGGQRQRILIARAVATKPGLLLFDEATNSLDSLSQKRIARALGALDCTRIVVAHRLSTVRDCDRIVVLEGGAIVEDGTYDELMAKRGAFWRLEQEQLP